MRHAWMIIAHNNFPILEKQLRFLDSENADVFLHIDAKVKDFDFDRFRSVPKKSSVTFAERHSISWGDFSMVEAELSLLKAALPGDYDYFHLLSGVDVPIKTREYIEGYFEDNDNINYVNFAHPEISKHDRWRVRFYYPFQHFNIRKNWLRRFLRNASIGVQLIAGVDRTRKYPEGTVFQKGTQWFDITRSFAEYVLSREDWIRETFRATYCPDELVFQSLAAGSSFRDTLRPNAYDGNHRNCCRYLDWKRGNPYVFTEDDYEELIHADPACLFARKFDYTSHPGIVDRLFETFGEN